MHVIGLNQRRCECFVQFARWRHQERSVPSLTAFACTITKLKLEFAFSAILISMGSHAPTKVTPALYSISSDDYLQLPLPDDVGVTPAHNSVNSVATNSVIVTRIRRDYT